MKYSYTPINTTVATIVLTAATYGQALPSQVILSATDPRPLAKAGELFERKYGIPMSYEDVAYAYDGDVIDQTSPEYKKTHPEGKALMPKGCSVELRGQAGAIVRTPMDAKLMFQTVLDGHARVGNPGVFALLQNNDGLVIVPTSGRNWNGALVQDHSPLDTSISFPELRRTAVETLELICNTVADASGKKVVVGTTPLLGLPGQTVAIIGAANEQARSVLFRMLSSLQPSDLRTKAPSIKLAWQLFYDPGQSMYVMNVHQVMMEASSPIGVKILRPVTR